MDVGQNGRPRGPQMDMSSLVLTIHNFGVPNFDPYPYTYIYNYIYISIGYVQVSIVNRVIKQLVTGASP